MVSVTITDREWRDGVRPPGKYKLVHRDAQMLATLYVVAPLHYLLIIFYRWSWRIKYAWGRVVYHFSARRIRDDIEAASQRGYARGFVAGYQRRSEEIEMVFDDFEKERAERRQKLGEEILNDA